MGRSVRKFKETVEIRSTYFQRLRSHRFVPALTLALALAAAACLHIWQRVAVIELARETTELRARNRALIDNVKKLQSDISTLSMPSRIESYAIDSLGMQSVSADRLFTLVRQEEKEIPADEFATMFHSIRRIADYLPVMTEAEASSRELKPIRFESDADGDADQ
jgi:cell division protein FtsL